MTELLAPAGSWEAFVAAIDNGADAIYLGMNKFGARAYANNFDLEELKKAIIYAHLRNVKIYVTMNTIVYDNELTEAYKQIDDMYYAGVDGVIIQDLAIFTYVVNNYPKMEAHCSTQMGLDDLDGALLLKELGAKRVVLSREVPYPKLKEIKQKLKLPIEIFVHGALCVSYSGNCLMSGLIGYRSGNRGRCVGSCRKKYKLVNTTANEVLTDSYVLSMKDLNTLEHIDELKAFDSLKIEGRMKEPVYVSNVTRAYYNALNNKKDKRIDLTKTFNRTFTRGYIFGEDKKNITNILKPNNFGNEIGIVKRKTKLGYELELFKELNQGDCIRIDHNNEDVNLTVQMLYDKDDNLISSSNKTCFIKIKEELYPNDIVYKTKDLKYYNMVESLDKVNRQLPIDISVYGEANQPLTINIECDNKYVTIESDFMLDKALNKPTDSDQFLKQFNRLGDTPYYINNLEYYAENVFIPASKINDIRRIAIEKLNNERLNPRKKVEIKPEEYDNITFEEAKNITVFCNTLEQYEACQKCGIKDVYYDNVIRRNQVDYKPTDKDLLIGGYGGIHFYRSTNKFSTDFSLNAVNFKAVYMLHKLGANRVCLSHEINKDQINDLVNDYYKATGGYPNLEMIVYGRADMMFTNYCPLKVMNQCGKCKQNNYEIMDEYGNFPIISHKDCTTTILNGKILNLLDDLNDIKHVNNYRIQLTTESFDESVGIINKLQNKLFNNDTTRCFNKETDTRGHFNKEIL